jgi:hypothetical protein
MIEPAKRRGGEPEKRRPEKRLYGETVNRGNGETVNRGNSCTVSPHLRFSDSENVISGLEIINFAQVRGN